MRKNPCKECPWINKNNHSMSWPKYVEKMGKIGKIENNTHSCHMITRDVWGYKSEIDTKNVCIGSITKKDI